MLPTRNFLKSFTFDANQYQSLLQFVEKPLGKICLLAIFSWFLLACGGRWWPMTLTEPLLPWWPVVTIILTLMTFLPLYRRQLLLFANLYGISQLPWFAFSDIHQYFIKELHIHLPLPWAVYMACVIILAMLANGIYIYISWYLAQRRRWQHPLACLLIITIALFVVAASISPGLPKLVLWSFIAVQSGMIWFVGYTLLQLKQLNTKPVWRQFSHYLPFWGGTNTPFPKGAAYLQKIEARTSRELALSQLGGVVLIFWAYLLMIILAKLQVIMNVYQVPSFEQALSHCQQGTPYPPHIAWLILFWRFSRQLLGLAINGHIIISICRMAGFNALRNTYRPLFAPTIADFWNRYYFYFKELLVEMFFYPTYFRFFKRYPQLRMIAATMMAACVGNIIYHFIWGWSFMMRHTLWATLTALQGYCLYAMVLGLVISISQLRERPKLSVYPVVNGCRQYVVTPLVVIGFYVLLTIFNEPFVSTDVGDNILFLVNLV